MRRTKDQRLDQISIDKWIEFLRQVIKLENKEIFDSIKIKKEMLYGYKIYIEVQDAFTYENTWFPYVYMFWINILWDPIWKYFISFDIYQNLKEANRRLIINSNKQIEWQKYYSEQRNLLPKK